jgi:mRNA-degrading endonuclease RelE of RelBE toxin-antitoxin system
MAAPFIVRFTPRFKRLFRRLSSQHPHLSDHYNDVIEVLAADPHNRTGVHDIKKLINIESGDGQWRIRSGRFRFRYDIYGEDVVLQYCGLRREDTYR